MSGRVAPADGLLRLPVLAVDDGAQWDTLVELSEETVALTTEKGVANVLTSPGPAPATVRLHAASNAPDSACGVVRTSAGRPPKHMTWWSSPASIRGPSAFQADALPTELLDRADGELSLDLRDVGAAPAPPHGGPDGT